MFFPYAVHSTHTGHWSITLPDFPLSSSRPPRSNDPKEAAENLLVSSIKGAISARYQIPVHDDPPSDHVIGVSPLVAMKIRLSNGMLGMGVTKTELARRIGADQTRVDRILDPTHNSQIETMETAFAALGLRVVLAADDHFAPRVIPYFIRPGDNRKTFAAKNLWIEEHRLGDDLHHTHVHRKNDFAGFLRIPAQRYRLAVQNVPNDVKDGDFTLTGNEPILAPIDSHSNALCAQEALVALDHNTGMLD